MTIDPSKSCRKCPSFLKPTESVSKFKKSIGTPMCGKFGHVLGKPGAPAVQSEKLQVHFANRCPAFGQSLPPIPEEYRLEIAMPDPETRIREVEEERREACRTCATCTNFVRDDIVANELGWTAGLCAAKGKLILPNRAVYEAKGCQYREFGHVRSSTAGIHLLPVYEDAFQLNLDPVVAYFKNKGNFVEPHEYPTDKALTAEDEASGIRAWRLIKDPAGSGNEVYLPCYDPAFFSNEEAAKIPRTGDQEHPEQYIDHFGGIYLLAVAWTGLDETPALWGAAGTGKTELFRHASWLMCLPFERISITRSTELDDLAGKSHYTPEKGTFFEYGRLPLAWMKPCVVCIDEPNTGPSDVWQFFRPLMDNSKQLVMDMNEGERLLRNDDCYMGLAMNPAWDARNIGAEPIADADARRLFHLYLEMPPAQLEREMISNHVRNDGWEIDNERLDTIMAIAVELRGLSNEGTIPVSWGIAPQIKVARATRWFDLITSYNRAIGDFLEPDAREAMLGVVRAHAV